MRLTVDLFGYPLLDVEVSRPNRQRRRQFVDLTGDHEIADYDEDDEELDDDEDDRVQTLPLAITQSPLRFGFGIPVPAVTNYGTPVEHFRP